MLCEFMNMQILEYLKGKKSRYYIGIVIKRLYAFEHEITFNHDLSLIIWTLIFTLSIIIALNLTVIVILIFIIVWIISTSTIVAYTRDPHTRTGWC